MYEGEPLQSTDEAKGLGDMVSGVLASVGVTEESVGRWLGKPCGCKERREKLNRLGTWVKRMLKGRTDNAREYLDAIMSED